MNRPTRTTLSVLLAVTLSACATQSNPRLAMTELAGGHLLSAEESAARYDVNPEWWTAYGDQQLNALIEQAFANNIDLKQAAITVNKALYQAKQLGAELVPAFSGSLGGSRSDNLDSGEGSKSYSSNLSISYELDLWRKLAAQADAQTWEYRATQQDLAATRLSLANSIANAYFNLAYLNEAVALNEKSSAQYREILRITRAKYQYGKVAAIEAVSAEQSLLSAENTLLSLRQEREEQLAALRNLLNLRPGENMAADPAAFRLADAAQVDLNVPLSVLANRPDLQAAEARLQSAWQSVEAQRRSWYPSITLGAGLSTSSDRSASLFNVPFLGNSIQINLPFLNWNTLKWQDKTAQANFDSAKLSFEQTLTTALNEVGQYYAAYRSAAATLSKQQQRYALAQKSSRYYQIRYQHGKNELKDWLDALNSEYSQAQTTLNNRYSILKAENAVYQTMAGRYRQR